MAFMETPCPCTVESTYRVSQKKCSLVRRAPISLKGTFFLGHLVHAIIFLFIILQLKLKTTRATSSFSEALLPSLNIASDRDSGEFSQSPSLLEKFYEKFSRSPEPDVADQLEQLSKFSEPELIQITKVKYFSFYQ